MSERTDTLAEMLVPYGVNEEEARIYLVLLEGGVMSALSISRKLKMGRTKVYRILDKLIAKEMVRQRFSEKGLTFEASDPTCLRTLVTRKEAEAAILKETLPELTRLLEQQTGRGKPGSKVLYYHGQKGLSRVNWNLLRATGEFVSFEVTTVLAFLPEKEGDELRRELVENKIFSRNLYNSKYIRSFIQVKEMVTECWEARYVDPLLTINADVFIS